mgnify:CR=1 FL=1
MIDGGDVTARELCEGVCASVQDYRVFLWPVFRSVFPSRTGGSSVDGVRVVVVREGAVSESILRSIEIAEHEQIYRLRYSESSAFASHLL